MRKRSLCGLLLLASCGLLQAKVLVVTPSNPGSPVTKLTLAVETSLRFSETNFEVVTPSESSSATFAYKDVRTLTFGDDLANERTEKAENTAMQLRLVQNPVRDLLRVEGYEGGRAQLRIVSMNGATIFSSPWQGEDVDVSALKTGFYVLVINSQSIKFIKQ